MKKAISILANLVLVICVLLIAAAVWVLPLTAVAFVAVKVLLSRPMITRRAKYMKEILSYD